MRAAYASLTTSGSSASACSRSTSARAPREHRALVDVALVGDLAGVDVGRRAQHQRPHRRLRGAGAGIAQRAHHAEQGGVQGLARLRRGLRAGEHQQPDLAAVVARDHDVLNQRRQPRHQLDPQRADRDPGAAGELEVLGHAAVEHHAALGPRRVREVAGVADAVVALVVEGLGGLARRVAVAREHRDALDPHLQLVAVGHELQLQPRQRRADAAGAVEPPVRRGDGRRGLGGAPRGGEPQRLPRPHAPRDRLQPLPGRRRQRRRGIEGQPQPRHHLGRQRIVGFQEGQQHVEAARHVEQQVGRTSRRLRSVFSISPGAGRPSSM